MSINTPTLTEAVSDLIDSKIGEIHTSLPAQIETYDHTASKASVKPLLKRKYTDGTVLELPVIPNVPVMWPRTGDAIIHFPLNRGDRVLLVFAERSLDFWLSKGTDAEPPDSRKFNLSDAIAIPGLYSFNETSKAPDNSSFSIVFKNAKITLQSNGGIEIDTPGAIKVSGTTVEMNGATGATAPTGPGPFCALPACLFTGAPHQTDKVS